ncbi:putative pantothenate transporter [Lophiostoma macrostomum CBS 122681]|uniref:Putative pantothenate transporter n=1 Tax=Lophiostoma macrostomum CBS 122681 TaxID=1314788 RepID=A0A6A6T7W4_9PLEO|nr:putative pantothenate transporter [Lophiostoma macrostomum CBS 122681]
MSSPKGPKNELDANPASTTPSLPSEQSSTTDNREGPRSSGKARRAFRSFQRYAWDDPDKPKHEKWFLFKLDVFLLSVSCLGYFSKNLQCLRIWSMYGSELTYTKNVFTAGYVVGQMPAVILASRIRPSLLIPTLEICWSILTFCSSTVKTVPQLYAIRFLVGVCESGYFPVMIYLIGSWYTKEERGKRVALFYCTAALAGMFSGYLQAGAYSGLDGVMGRQGWQWLFIVCGIISLPIAFLGYFFIPDFPETTRAFYITKEEAERRRQSLLKDGQKPLGAQPWDRKKFFRIAKQWQFWVLPIGYFFVQGSFATQQPAYALWLKATGHSVYVRNVWPTGQVAVGVVVQILAGILSDSPLLKGRRWPAIIVMQGGALFGTIILAIWDVPDGLRYVAYYFSYFAAGVPGPYYAWYSDLIPHDHEMRGFVIAVSNMFSYIQGIWFSIAVWRTVDAPRFHAGFIAASVLGVAMITLTLTLRLLQKKDERTRAKEAEGTHDIEAPETSHMSVEAANNVVEAPATIVGTKI